MCRQKAKSPMSQHEEITGVCLVCILVPATNQKNFPTLVNIKKGTSHEFMCYSEK